MFYLKRNFTSKAVFILLLPISLVVFHIIGLYTGQAYIVNRYGLYAITPIAIFIGFLVEKTRFPIKALIVSLLIYQVVLLMREDPASLEERLDFTHSESGREMMLVSDWIQDHPISNQTLISFFTGDNVIFLAKIPFRKIIYEGNQDLWDKALKEPNKFVQRIVVVKNPTLDPIEKHIQENPTILNDFRPVFDGQFYRVYDRTE